MIFWISLSHQEKNLSGSQLKIHKWSSRTKLQCVERIRSSAHWNRHGNLVVANPSRLPCCSYWKCWTQKSLVLAKRERHRVQLCNSHQEILWSEFVATRPNFSDCFDIDLSHSRDYLWFLCKIVIFVCSYSCVRHGSTTLAIWQLWNDLTFGAET